MNERVLDILDQSLKYSLWAFLLTFLASLCFIALQLKARKQGFAEYLREEFEKRYKEEITGEDPGKVLDRTVPLANRLPMVVQALVVSAVLAFGCFLVVGFTPLSFFGNFATENPSQATPLRLTLLAYDRFYDGFSLNGEVWNQSQESMEGLRALISIWKSDRELLDEITVQVEPDPLSPGSAGVFSLRYTENSPFLYGYQVTFSSNQDLTVPHVQGFEVE